MGHIDSETYKAFMAFGEASIAFSEAAGPENRCHPTSDAMDAVASDLLVELMSAHSRLRDLFADGRDDAVCALAPQVIELANRMADALGKDQLPPSI